LAEGGQFFIQRRRPGFDGCFGITGSLIGALGSPHLKD